MPKSVKILLIYALTLIPFLETFREYQLVSAIAFGIYFLDTGFHFIGKQDIFKQLMIVPPVLFSLIAFFSGDFWLFFPLSLYPLALEKAEGNPYKALQMGVIVTGAVLSFLTGDSSGTIAEKFHSYSPLFFACIFPLFVSKTNAQPCSVSEIKESEQIDELKATIEELREENETIRGGLPQRNLLTAILGLDYAGFDYDSAVKKTIDTIYESAEAIFVSYYRLDNKAQKFILKAQSGKSPLRLEKETPSGIGMIGRVVTVGQYIYINDLHNKEQDEAKRNLLKEMDALLSIPILSNGEIVAAIYMGLPKMRQERESDTLNLCLIAAEKLGREFEKMDCHITVKKQGETDQLTGLYNRQYFDKIFDKEFQRAKHNGQPMAYIELDMDYFKQMNDSHGHQFGDQVLQTAAEVFQRNVRPSDVVCRTGGDEFSIILIDADKAVTFEVLKRIKEDYTKVAEEKLFVATKDGEAVKSSLSMGAAVCPHDKIKHPTDLIKLADAAVYYVKNNGKNNFAIAK